MLQAVADIWWPQIHREIVLLVQTCNQCKNAGKNLKTIKSQSEFEKITAAEAFNDELALDFAGPFKSAHKNKQYLLVAIDHKTGWPSAKHASQPTTEKVIEFLNEYIIQNGIPKRIRTDPATIFRGEKFKEFCKNHFITHIECPIQDHRGNGKVERLIRTINERIRAEKTIITEKGNVGLTRLLFALRTAATANGNSPFENVFGQKPNTIKNILIEKPNNCLENDSALQLSPEDFPKDNDPTILMRNKTKNTKLEGHFKQRKGRIVSESDHLITMETKRGRQTISKRDIAKEQPKSASYSPKTTRQRGDSKSLERKIAALKEAEQAKMNKTPTKQKAAAIKQTENRKSPRKQTKPRRSLGGFPEKHTSNIKILDTSSDEDEQNTTKPNEEEEKKFTASTSKAADTTARSSQRTKKKPNWYGQNVMVQKVEQQQQTREEADNSSETKTEEELRRELEAIPNFLEMSPEEIQKWINE